MEPPSDRVASDAARASLVAELATARMAIAAGALTALVGGAVVTILGSLFDLSAGLLVIAFFVGRFTAQAMAAATDPALRSTIRRGGLAAIAVGLALVGVALGGIGLWVVARAQGGSLDLVAFLAETYGPLVPGALVLAALGAWWPLRRRPRS